MAACAAFRLDWKVLKREWPLFLGVALEANGVLIASSAEFLGYKRTVLIMAILTVHQALSHPMSVRAIEFRPHFCMAGKTQLWHLIRQQAGDGLGVVNGVTTYTAHVRVSMDA
jgi:hypothetical protein